MICLQSQPADWEMWGPCPPLSLGGIGVDCFPVCPGAAVFLSPCLPFPPVSISLTCSAGNFRHGDRGCICPKYA